MASEPLEQRDAIDGPAALAWLRDNRQRLLRFALVGLSGVFVNLAMFSLVFYVVLTPVEGQSLSFLLANGAGFVVSVFTNFLLNDGWTWGDRQKGGRRQWLRRLARYYLTASGAGMVQLFFAWISLWLWTPLVPAFMGFEPAPMLSVLTGIAAGMAVNFTASHLWAFRDIPSPSDL